MKDIEKILEKRKKEYEQTITEQEMLSQTLRDKDKKELVGIIMGIIIAGALKK